MSAFRTNLLSSALPTNWLLGTEAGFLDEEMLELAVAESGGVGIE